RDDSAAVESSGLQPRVDDCFPPAATPGFHTAIEQPDEGERMKLGERATRRFWALTPLAAALWSAGVAGPAFAADAVWFGGSGDWENASNWSTLSVPSASDRAILPNGTATLSNARSVGALQVT